MKKFEILYYVGCLFFGMYLNRLGFTIYNSETWIIIFIFFFTIAMAILKQRYH